MDDATCPHCALPSRKTCDIFNHPSPYAAYFLPAQQNLAVPQTELRSFILEAENELTDYNAYIARVTRLLTEERQARQSFLKQHKRLLIHIHGCPPEIMLEIFLHCLDWNIPATRPCYNLWGPGMPVPWVLSAVCRRWRNILSHSPTYWTSFIVGPQLHFLEDALQLSKQAPLYPVLFLGDGDGNDSPSSVQALVRHTSRWKTLRVGGSRDAFASLGQLGNLPNLKKLFISLQTTINPDDHEPLDDEEIMDISTAMAPFIDCPQLEELAVSLAQGLFNNDIIFEMSSLSFPWSNLSKLAVSFGIDLSDVVRSLLLVCPNLRELSAYCLCYETSVDVHLEPLLLHSGITSLTLMNPMYLLHQTDFPALTHLSLENTSPNQILPFLSRHRHHITHFQVVLENDTEDARSNWHPVLHLLPDVVHFTIHLREHQHIPWAMISASIETQLPRLRTLVLHMQCHLLSFCESWGIVSLVGYRWAGRELETLEIHALRVKDWSSQELNEDIVSWKIENSATIRTLLGFKEEGLEVNINGIPLSDRSALLYM